MAAQDAMLNAAMKMAEDGNTQLCVFTAVKGFLERSCKECDADKATWVVKSLLKLNVPM